MYDKQKFSNGDPDFPKTVILVTSLGIYGYESKAKAQSSSVKVTIIYKAKESKSRDDGCFFFNFCGLQHMIMHQKAKLSTNSTVITPPAHLHVSFRVSGQA